MQPIEYLANKSLDKSTPVPLYHQLKQILLEYVREGHESLPTEIELCRHFEVSRPTVRQAINQLVLEGYLDRIKGKGTFISQPKMDQDYLLAIESFNDEMQQKGVAHRTEVLEFGIIKAGEEVASALELPPGSEAIKLLRLRSITDNPMLYVETYLPYGLFKGILDFNMEEHSLYDVVEKNFGYTIGGSQRTIEAIKATEPIASLLGIPVGDPVQYIESLGYLDDGTIFEYTLASYRGDLNKFTFELTREKGRRTAPSRTMPGPNRR